MILEDIYSLEEFRIFVDDFTKVNGFKNNIEEDYITTYKDIKSLTTYQAEIYLTNEYKVYITVRLNELKNELKLEDGYKLEIKFIDMEGLHLFIVAKVEDLTTSNVNDLFLKHYEVDCRDKKVAWFLKYMRRLIKINKLKEII